MSTTCKKCRPMQSGRVDHIVLSSGGILHRKLEADPSSPLYVSEFEAMNLCESSASHGLSKPSSLGFRSTCKPE